VFHSIRIKNFKVWKSQLWDNPVSLSRINLILGANSTGKTSLLQPFLLLKQTVESPDRQIGLSFGGSPSDLVDLGTWEHIIHQQAPNTDRTLCLQLEEGPPEESGDETLEVRVGFSMKSSNLHQTELELTHKGAAFALRRTPKGGYRMSAPNYTPPKASGSRNFCPQRAFFIPEEAARQLGEQRQVADDLSLRIMRALNKVVYLGPLRSPPQPWYMWGGQEPGSIGTSGENAVAALLASLHANKKDERRALVESVSTWLKRMGVAEKLELRQQGGRNYEVIVTTAGRETNLVHVGFGVSQVLPMIVLALTAKPGSTIIAEQPEIHLHPRAQTELANLLVETAKDRNLQYIVETHSEHLFRRMQFLLADETLRPQDCRLYFVDHDDQLTPVLTTLRIDPFGRVANWPKAFFGDAIGEAERQMRAMLSRLASAGSTHG
jgi:predicted ATPase